MKKLIIQVKAPKETFRKDATVVARRAIQEFSRGVNAMEAEWKNGNFQITVKEVEESTGGD